LAHDLGHPPFGHIGEHTLDKLVRANGDTDGFEGNAQSFRVVTKLAVRFPDALGIDLTRATLAAMLKYPWVRGSTGPKSKKWSAYRSEREDFNFARKFHAGDLKTLEAELMDWADDVAYSVHDLEDFHRCNVIPWRKIFSNPDAVISGALKSRGTTASAQKDRLTAALERLRKHLFGNFGALLQEAYEGRADQREQLRRMTSQLIGRYIQSIQIVPLHSGKRPVTFDEDAWDEVTVLKQITRDYVIGNPSLMAQQEGQKRILRELFTAIFDAIDDKSEYPAFLPVRLRYLKEISDNQSARFVADCIATLSEKEAIGLHGRLFGTATGSVLDPIVR
jgi:dGTPase